MPTIVVPYRGRGGKRRLAPLDDEAREVVAAAMLSHVVAAATAVGRTLVVAAGLPRGLADAPVELVDDPGRGQGAAVAAALAHVAGGPALVVNADLPCATPRDLLALLGELPEGGLAVAAAAEGRTNARALAPPSLFEPVYGPGSAGRFLALAPEPELARTSSVPALADDVDTLDDLLRLRPRLGPSTTRALALLDLHAGAAA